MDAPTPAGLSTARQVSLVHVHGLYHRSVSNHPMPSRRRFNTLPFSATGFHASARVWTSPFTRRLVKTSGRIEFVILRTDSSSPVASHPASRRRSYIRLQAGERMPEEDSHLSDHVRFRAHECGGSAPLWLVAERRFCRSPFAVRRRRRRSPFAVRRHLFPCSQPPQPINSILTIQQGDQTNARLAARTFA